MADTVPVLHSEARSWRKARQWWGCNQPEEGSGFSTWIIISWLCSHPSTSEGRTKTESAAPNTHSTQSWRLHTSSSPHFHNVTKPHKQEVAVTKEPLHGLNHICTGMYTQTQTNVFLQTYKCVHKGGKPPGVLQYRGFWQRVEVDTNGF